MSEEKQVQEDNNGKAVPVFDTEHGYAIIAGWLIVPALNSLFSFLGAVIMVFVINPLTLSGIDLAIYSVDAFTFIYIPITYFFWFKRKKVLPYLMMGYFSVMSLWFIIVALLGYGYSFMNIALSIIWIIYFYRSERVKQTFIR